jgi:hypothetical protein
VKDIYPLPETKLWQQVAAVVLLVGICSILWCALWVAVGLLAAIAWFLLEAGWQMI